MLVVQQTNLTNCKAFHVEKGIDCGLISLVVAEHMFGLSFLIYAIMISVASLVIAYGLISTSQEVPHRLDNLNMLPS